MTPQRKRAVSALARRNYRSAAFAYVSMNEGSRPLFSIVAKEMRAEMSNLCSLESSSILRDNHEALKHFSWKTLWLEYSLKVPSLVQLLQKLLPKADMKFICFVVSIILKKRCMHVCLLQRVFSVLLYGNGTGKQVQLQYW